MPHEKDPDALRAFTGNHSNMRCQHQSKVNAYSSSHVRRDGVKRPYVSGCDRHPTPTSMDRTPELT